MLTIYFSKYKYIFFMNYYLLYWIVQRKVPIWIILRTADFSEECQ